MQERGFLSLSTALLSSSILRVERGHVMEIFMDVTSSIEAVILSFLFCRSGWPQLAYVHTSFDYYQKLEKEIQLFEPLLSNHCRLDIPITGSRTF